MDNIIRKIQELYPVSDDSLHLLKYCFKQQTFPAKTIIIQAGRFTIRFILYEKGITRSYILHRKRNNNMVFYGRRCDLWSWDLYRHKAGFEYVETLEETLTYSISIDKLNDLYKSRIDIANWMRVLQQENFLLLQDIHISRLNLSAQERYEKLIKEYPSIFHRVTLGHIASFLGITQPSLSRIRSSR